MKVGVVGASGYVGGETLRLLVNHPKVEIAMVTSRTHAGQYLHRIQPSLKGFTNLTFSDLDYDRMSDRCDLVITAVPHGTATEIVKAFCDRGIRVIDLSADYRLHNADDYVRWYGWAHPHPEYLEKSVFGVPELHRDKIKDSQLVSCPGCMAVTSGGGVGGGVHRMQCALASSVPTNQPSTGTPVRLSRNSARLPAQRFVYR